MSIHVQRMRSVSFVQLVISRNLAGMSIRRQLLIRIIATLLVVNGVLHQVGLLAHYVLRVLSILLAVAHAASRDAVCLQLVMGQTRLLRVLNSREVTACVVALFTKRLLTGLFPLWGRQVINIFVVS